MHNGGIADFHLVKRRLQADLSDEVFHVVQGNTGRLVSRVQELRLLSECRLRVGFCIIFVQGRLTYSLGIALTCSKLSDAKAKSFTHQTLQRAMLDTIASLNDYADLAGITEV